MGSRMWWSRVMRFLRPQRDTAAQPPATARTRAEQATDRETRRQTGMSDEDRAWEQVSLQRDRERQAPARPAADSAAR